MRKGLRDRVRPLCMSHGYGLDFGSEFLWSATVDYSGFLAIPAAVAVIDRLGHAGLLAQQAELLEFAVEHCCAAWGTSPLQGPHPPTLACVALPTSSRYDAKRPGQAERVRCRLRDEYNLETVIFAYDDGSRYGAERGQQLKGAQMWCRLSCAIHNTKSDYERLATAVSEVMKKKDPCCEFPK